MRFNVRQSKTLVLPEPGPAVRSNGPFTYWMASSWALVGLKPVSSQKWDMCGIWEIVSKFTITIRMIKIP